jgi:hypothetical protein
VGVYQSQEAIGLALECRDRDGPQPRATAQLLAALGDVNMRRACDRSRPVETIHAFDGRDLRVPHATAPCIDRRRLVAGTDSELGQADPRVPGRPRQFSVAISLRHRTAESEGECSLTSPPAFRVLDAP